MPATKLSTKRLSEIGQDSPLTDEERKLFFPSGEPVVYVTVEIKGGCCQDVSVVDNKGNPVKFELTIDDKD
jgi:hypothetical protein